MLGSYVCRRCRARISRRIAPVRNPQWQPRATFLSLRQKTSPQQNEPQQEAQSQERSDESRIEPPTNPPPIRIEGLKGEAQPRAQRPLGRYSRRAQGDIENESIGPDEQGPDQVQIEGISGHAVEQANWHGPASAIEAAFKKGNLRQAWRLFEEHYTSRDCLALKEPSLTDVTLLKNSQVFFDLLSAVNASFCKRNDKPVVTPTAVLFKYEQLGLTRPEFWQRQTLGYLMQRVILSVNNAAPESARDLQSLLLELLSVWRLFFQCKGQNKKPLESVSSEWNLPAMESLPEFFQDRPFQRRMQLLHPDFPSNPIMSFCAAYMYSLSDALKASELLKTEAEPFLQVIQRLLAGSSVNTVTSYMQQSNLFTVLADDVQKEVIKDINAAPVKALREIGVTATSTKRQSTNPIADLEEFQLKRMARAVMSRNSSSALDVLWKNSCDIFQKDGKLAIPPRIYNGFLSGFTMLHRGERAVEVWNHMIAHGVTPDTQSWSALLDGCSKSKDTSGFKGIWTRMLNTGIEPDNYLWTSRVNGLFSMGNMKEGLAALDDMGKRWYAAETVENAPTKGPQKTKTKAPVKAVNKCTKPSIEVINGAITAIVSRPARSMSHATKVDFIQKILGWARNFDIKPDAITYNSLINLYLRAGDSKTAFKVLNQMEKDGIAADIATFNMLINSAFDNDSFANMTPSQQTDKILSLFASLEEGGLTLTDYNYSTAINRLLKEHSNYDAVRSLIEHMTQRNLVPSAHAYTSLISYYFQLEPPAIPAVDQLIHEVFTSQRVPTDGYLFDRTLEGYAAHREIGRMMSVLTRMSKHDRLPGWTALIRVVEALVQDGDIHRAREVVRDVVRVEGIAKDGVRGGSTGEAKFFAKVRSFGLGLEEERMGDFMGVKTQVGQGEPVATPIEGGTSESVGKDHISPSQTWNGEAVEEDVHGFLRDEHEDIHAKVDRP